MIFHSRAPIWRSSNKRSQYIQVRGESQESLLLIVFWKTKYKYGRFEVNTQRNLYHKVVEVTEKKTTGCVYFSVDRGFDTFTVLIQNQTCFIIKEDMDIQYGTFKSSHRDRESSEQTDLTTLRPDLYRPEVHTSSCTEKLFTKALRDCCEAMLKHTSIILFVN